MHLPKHSASPPTGLWLRPRPQNEVISCIRTAAQAHTPRLARPPTLLQCLPRAVLVYAGPRWPFRPYYCHVRERRLPRDGTGIGHAVKASILQDAHALFRIEGVPCAPLGVPAAAQGQSADHSELCGLRCGGQVMCWSWLPPAERC